MTSAPTALAASLLASSPFVPAQATVYQSQLTTKRDSDQAGYDASGARPGGSLFETPHGRQESYCRARYIRTFASRFSIASPETSTSAFLTVPVKAKGGR